MKKLLFVPLILIALSGCDQTGQVITSTKFARIAIPSEYYNCPDPKIPYGQKIKESDIARYLVQIKQARDTCKLSLDTIHKWADAYNSSIQ
ncbi:MAG: hypothetical protein P4M11_01915 [Candidatus Pacebacteria bacterium]|nr:hypothetical protein [Candidatus Paceibacterota bacterium]